MDRVSYNIAFSYIENIRLIWIHRFCSEMSLPPPANETSPFMTKPTDVNVKGFLRWLLVRRKGIAGSKLAVTTLRNKWNTIVRAVLDEAGYEYAKGEQKEMIAYIEKTLITPEYGASTKGRPKPLADLRVARDVLYFLWACDENSTKHPRVRVQLSFAILLLLYQGLRPGEFVQSSAHRKSNEGLKYRDVTLTAIPCKDGNMRWALRVKIRNQKNHCNKEADDVVHLLFDEPENPFLCPVTHYCALAFADDAFKAYKCPSDLNSVRRHVDIRIKPEMADVPILRGLTAAGQISKTNILSVDALGILLAALGRRAGYRDTLTPYCFRRGFGNSIINVVSSVDRRLLMGHQDEATFMHYISRISGIDAKSVILGRNQETAMVGFLRSMAGSVNHTAPVPHGSCLTHSKRLMVDIPSPGNQHTDDTYLTTPKMTTLQHYEARRRARRSEFQKKQSTFFETCDENDQSNDCDDFNETDDLPEDQDFEARTETNHQTATAEVLSTSRPGPTRYLLAVLHYEPSRLKLVDMLLQRPLLGPTAVAESISDYKMTDAITLFADIAKPTITPVHYQNAKPDADKCCPRCHKRLSNMAKLKVNRHLLKCFLEQERNQALLQANIARGELDLRNCLWTSCSQSFSTSNASGVANHITSHVTRSRYNVCHWSTCSAKFDSKIAMMLHLQDVHHVHCDDTIPVNPEYCYECREIFYSNIAWENHCQEHIDSKLTLFCGQIIHLGLLVVASLCPFCLSSAKSAASRAYQWNDCYNFHKHISTHLPECSWPLLCPHPLCDDCILDKEGLWYHLNVVHGVEPRAKGKRSHEEVDTGEESENCSDSSAQSVKKLRSKQVGGQKSNTQDSTGIEIIDITNN